MTKDTATSLRIDTDNTEVVNSFCFLGSTLNNEGISSQEQHHRQKLGLGKDSDVQRCICLYKDLNHAGNVFSYDTLWKDTTLDVGRTQKEYLNFVVGEDF